MNEKKQNPAQTGERNEDGTFRPAPRGAKRLDDVSSTRREAMELFNVLWQEAEQGSGPPGRGLTPELIAPGLHGLPNQEIIKAGGP